MRVVDLRGEAGYPLSAPLLGELGKIAQDGGKAILLLNRRGVAPALHCRACGETLRCDNCDVALVLHRDERLHCHHCGHAEPAPEACPACRSVELARIGAGTQRLERELAERVPELERIRLDADSAGKRGELAATLRRFAEGDRVVLIGTQMVAKGHHFGGVALAAVVDADLGLGLPDFRAEERTFQLLTQLAGRSGRDAPGKVLVQTFQPESRAVALAARHDVAGFLEGEIDRRRELDYPPFRHLVRILVSGPEQADPLQALTELAAGLESADAEIVGPAPLYRLRGRYRAQLVAKTDATTRARIAGGPAPVGRSAGDAEGRPGGGGRRRPPGRLITLGEMSEMSEAEEIRNEELDAERQARRRIALAQVRQYPDPVLRMRANDVEEFDGDLRQLAERMTMLMREALGSAWPPTRSASCSGCSSSSRLPRTSRGRWSTRRSWSARTRPSPTTKAACRCRACSCRWSETCA